MSDCKYSSTVASLFNCISSLYLRRRFSGQCLGLGFEGWCLGLSLGREGWCFNLGLGLEGWCLGLGLSLERWPWSYSWF